MFFRIKNVLVISEYHCRILYFYVVPCLYTNERAWHAAKWHDRPTARLREWSLQ